MALIEATQDRAHDPARATDSGEFSPSIANPVVSPATLLSLESQLAHSLPGLLRDLYTQVGDGGYGPGYGLCRAEEMVERSLAWAEMYAQPSEKLLLPFVSWGCTVYSVLELHRGWVGVLDLTAVDDGLSPGEATHWQYDSLEAFWQAWLDGAELFFPMDEEE